MYHKENIPEINFREKLKEIEAKGFVKGTRSSDTAIGHTLESEMKVPENNLEEYDFTSGGKPIELKAQRLHTTSNITLFTKEPDKGDQNDKILIEKYGYDDIKGRKGLKITIQGKNFNNQGFRVEINREEEKVNIVHEKDGIVCHYTFDTLFNKLRKKLGERLLVVFAETEKREDGEYFHYTKAYFLENLGEEEFINLIESGKIVIEFRMHLKESGVARNHGTGFRMNEKNIDRLYEKKEVINLVS